MVHEGWRHVKNLMSIQCTKASSERLSILPWSCTEDVGLKHVCPTEWTCITHQSEVWTGCDGREKNHGSCQIQVQVTQPTASHTTAQLLLSKYYTVFCLMEGVLSQTEVWFINKIQLSKICWLTHLPPKQVCYILLVSGYPGIVSLQIYRLISVMFQSLPTVAVSERAQLKIPLSWNLTDMYMCHLLDVE
jgi:hypothetical protein